MRPALALVAAVASNGVIGRGGALPWRLPDDLRHFRALTTGHAVIMGRRTWDSLGRALPRRQNIVVSRQPGLKAEGAFVAGSLTDALARVELPEPAFCIGGAELYRLALPIAQTAYITEIARVFEGDAVFPSLDRARWAEAAREHHRLDAADGFGYDYVTYQRRGRT
ncbi:MAG: dihydrofolate reductase [Betaproteobacteria bacterium]|nr:dihydrofolate reductase [Betaproteobacteria bacterium]MDE2209381.1 dihydrofolate reductase [Betaproteobacteria bacterium]MDE2359669.1 dihydrofolate reductase [Betaproteobacteria bacterium]